MSLVCCSCNASQGMVVLKDLCLQQLYYNYTHGLGECKAFVFVWRGIWSSCKRDLRIPTYPVQSTDGKISNLASSLTAVSAVSLGKHPSKTPHRSMPKNPSKYMDQQPQRGDIYVEKNATVVFNPVGVTSMQNVTEREFDNKNCKGPRRSGRAMGVPRNFSFTTNVSFFRTHSEK